MGKNKYRGSKGQLRAVIQDAATQVQDMATTIAILLDRTGGTTTITADEFINLDTKRKIDVKVGADKSITLRMVKDGESEQEQDTPVPARTLTGADIGASAS